MKLVLFEEAGGDVQPGLDTARGIVSIAQAVPRGHTPQLTMQLRHNYNPDDMEHPVPALVEFATSIMTMHSGDLLACGTNHEGLGPLQDGERVELDIRGIGRMALSVRDPLRRSWEKGIYMGADSTNPEAVKRNRPGRAG